MSVVDVSLSWDVPSSCREAALEEVPEPSLKDGQGSQSREGMASPGRMQRVFLWGRGGL